MMGPAVLVTGGVGYIGAATCKALAKAGYTPVVYNNVSNGHENVAVWGPLIKTDIRYYGTLRDAIILHEVTCVLHFAACSLVTESVLEPQKYCDNNLAGMLVLLRAMLNTDTTTIVFLSSSAIYGEPEQAPIAESSAMQINPYGASKLMTERVLMDYVRAYGLQLVALRYFNAAGTDPDGEIGELRDPETHLIPRAMMSTRGNSMTSKCAVATIPRQTAPPSGTTYTSARTLNKAAGTTRRAESFRDFAKHYRFHNRRGVAAA